MSFVDRYNALTLETEKIKVLAELIMEHTVADQYNCVLASCIIDYVKVVNGRALELHEAVERGSWETAP